MLFDQDISRCFDDAIGAGGLTRADFDALLARTGPALQSLRGARATATLPLLTLPDRRDDLDMLVPLAERIRAQSQAVVVLGIGGSSLGAQAVVGFVDGGQGPQLHFPDNLDAADFKRLLAGLDLAATRFIVISKSGGTAETLAQTLVAMAATRDADAGPPAERFLFVTQPGDSPLRRLAARWTIEVLDHDPGLGGRYSVLSVVGMLPALIAGVDAEEVRNGAARVLDRALDAIPRESAPAIAAALAVGLSEAPGVGVNVLMAYANRLERFTMWYRQLWAESLGKGGHGSLPVAGLGPVDQHSQLQLYLDGPADKYFTILTLAHDGADMALETELAGDPALDYLTGHGLDDIVRAEAQATVETLAGKSRPVRVLHLPRADVEVLGGLFMHFMLETIIAGHLLGVDPFDQPAVEEGKRLTRSYLSGASGA